MAWEICNAACPLNSTQPPLLSSLPATCPRRRDRQADGQMGRDVEGSRRGPPLLSSLSLSLGGRQQPSDTRGKQKRCDGTTELPFTHMWLILPSNLLDNQRAGGKTYVRAEITGPVIMGNKASASRLCYIKDHQ